MALCKTFDSLLEDTLHASEDTGAREMVYEQVLTILFAISVGVAIIVYAAKPRQRSIPVSMAHATSIASFQADPTPQVAIAEAPVVATPVAAEPQSVVEVVPAVADVVTTTPSDAAPVWSTPSLDIPAEVSAAPTEIAAPASRSSRPHRASKRKSTTTKVRAKPRTRTKKN